MSLAHTTISSATWAYGTSRRVPVDPVGTLPNLPGFESWILVVIKALFVSEANRQNLFPLDDPRQGILSSPSRPRLR